MCSKFNSLESTETERASGGKTRMVYPVNVSLVRGGGCWGRGGGVHVTTSFH